MVKRIGSIRRKSRARLTQKKVDKGKLSLRKVLQTLNIGDKVTLKAEPSIHKGIYDRRFHGCTGVVKAKTGVCYEISVKTGGKQKIVIVHPVHLKKV